EDLVQSHMMKNVQLIANSKQLPDETTDLFEVIYDKIISAVNTEKGYTLDDLYLALLSGDTLFYLDGIDQVLISDTKFWESRSIEEPVSETLIRRQRDGFVENIHTNIVHLSHKIRDLNFRFRYDDVVRRSY